MQQFSFVVLTTVIFFSLYDYRKLILIWLPAQLLFNAQISVRYESPAISLQIAVNTYLLLFYFLFYKENDNPLFSYKLKFPLWGACILILSSYVISSIFGTYGSFRGGTSALKYFITDIGSVFLAFKMIRSSKDIRLFVKSSAVVFSIIILLGISEFILKDNLWADFVYFGSPHNATTEGRMYYIPPSVSGGMRLRYGMIRAISTFGIHIAFGVACAVYFWLFALMVEKKYYYISSMQTAIMAFMIILGIFLCNSKTGMVGLLLILLSLFSFKQLFKLKYIVAITLLAVLLFVCFPEYLLNYISLYDSELAEVGGGSTVETRQRQFEIALRLFQDNPLLGNGIGALDVLRKSGMNSDILGAESVWMQILPERGVFGMFAYFYLFIAYYQYLSKYMPKKTLIFFLLSIIVMATATGDITQAYWGVVLMAAGRMFQLRKHIITRKKMIYDHITSKG